MKIASYPLIIAHRGASAEAPENTLSAIKRAIALKVDYVEIDIRLSKEGIPIVLHDPSPARMMGVEIAPPIQQLTLPEIKKISLRQNFNNLFVDEKIPTLSEVLELDWKDTGLMIEIKECSKDHKLIANAVFQVLTQIQKPLPPIVIGSFSLNIVKESIKLSDQLNFPCEIIGIIEKKNMISPFMRQRIKRVALWYRLANWDMVKLLQENYLEIWAFTLDDPIIAKFLISLGVNGIVSNDPKKMMGISKPALL